MLSDAALPFAICLPRPPRAMLAAAILAAVLGGGLARPAWAQTESIVAVVNGDVISANDVANRGRLFALSTGMGISPEVLARLKPQVTRQLVDEKLKLDEIQRRHITVGDSDIAAAIKEIEQRNGLPPGGLRDRLSARGVAYRTLIDQIRVQIGWTRVLRQELGDRAQIADKAVDEQMKRLEAETGQPEYRISDIFVPIDNPANAGDARKFADTVISQLRAGAAFPVVAAQFSQSQNALQGGDEGWLHPDQMDPAVANIAGQMPVGAISNPIEVPGGLQIIEMRAKRQQGRDMATIVSLRQVFLPFTQQLDPQNPTDQQKHQLDVARTLERTLHSCDAMEAANKQVHSPRPADPGDVRLEQLNPPAFRTMVAGLSVGQVSKPLVAPDGIGLVMVCGKETKNIAAITRDDVRRRLLGERIELASQQLLRDLHRRAIIDRRAPVAHAPAE